MTLGEAEKIKNVVENKKYIEQLVETVSKTFVEAFKNFTIEDADMFKLGYNKAVDDFAKLLRETRDNRTLRVNCDDLEIRHMAERLKGGDGE